MIQASGDPSLPIFVVGEAPGREELKQGIPFVGPTGRIFWTVAREAGLSRSLCYVTNCVQSSPLGASGSPTATQINEEWARLDAEMAASEATILIVVGGIALKRVTGLSNITNMRGYCLTPEDCVPIRRKVRVQVGEYKTTKAGKFQKGDPRFAMKLMALPPVLPPNVKWIVPVLHPAGIMRMQFKTLPALKADLLRVGRLYRAETKPIGPDTVPVSAITLPEGTAIDIETPYPPNDWVVERIGTASKYGADTYGTPNSVETLTVKLQKMAQDPNATLIIHNAPFDLPRLGILDPRAKIFDTMAAAQLLNPDLPKGLERAATMHLDIRPWKHLDMDRPDVYNRMDAWAAYELAQKQRAILEKTGQMPVFENMMRGLPVLTRISLRGIKLGVEASAAWAVELEGRLHAALAEWPAHVNSASPFQIKDYLYGELKLPVQYGKDDKPTTDDAAIKHLLEDPRVLALCEKHEEARRSLTALRQIREASRSLATYANVETGEDGRVHPQYMTGDKEEAGASFTQKGQGAGSGRIQARNPNTMNQSDDARRLYVPSADDWCMAYIDWNSAEARVEASLSGDEALMQAIDGDLHEVVRSALGIDRTRAKNVYYGTGRGAGPKKLARVMAMAGFTVSVAECEAMQRRLFALFPKWTAWRNGVVAKARAKGYTTNPFGRRRYFYHSSAAPAMIGFIPQSTVADMLWSILPDVGPWLLTPVHDAVLIEAPKGEIHAVADRVREVMEQEWDAIAPGFRVPCTVKIGEPGASWGTLN